MLSIRLLSLTSCVDFCCGMRSFVLLSLSLSIARSQFKAHNAVSPIINENRSSAFVIVKREFQLRASAREKDNVKRIKDTHTRFHFRS